MTAEKIAVVTGAGGGIGRALVQKLAGSGWSIVLADQNRAAAEDAYERCRALGATAEIVACDVSRGEEVKALVEFTVRRFGRIDGFVANAGIAGLVLPITEFPEEMFDRVLSINMRGVFLSLKYALAVMQPQSSGSFVATASTAAIRGRANICAYIASKHAVLGLVRSAALECIGTGVRVNAVCPGPIQTPMIDAINEMAEKLNPGGPGVVRAVKTAYGKPEDVANTMAFLRSPEAAHMNGAALVIDAGSTVA
jgi:NAD(P)-dependent dehydrogenase (short-subunit alcohol dehydrogenase family)